MLLSSFLLGIYMNIDSPEVTVLCALQSRDQAPDDTTSPLDSRLHTAKPRARAVYVWGKRTNGGGMGEFHS
jgi:hypothetical protein